MRAGKITQLSHINFDAPGAPAIVAAALEPPALLKRIADLERRLTDLALRVYAIESGAVRRKGGK